MSKVVVLSLAAIIIFLLIANLFFTASSNSHASTTAGTSAWAGDRHERDGSDATNSLAYEDNGGKRRRGGDKEAPRIAQGSGQAEEEANAEGRNTLHAARDGAAEEGNGNRQKDAIASKAAREEVSPPQGDNGNSGGQGDAGEARAPSQHEIVFASDLHGFDPKSSIYVSRNVNVSYDGFKAVVPFQFRKAYASRVQGLNSENKDTPSKGRILIDPFGFIEEGRALATKFTELWRSFGKYGDFSKMPYSLFGSPFWIESVKKKLRIQLSEVKVRPMLGQILQREEMHAKLISQGTAKRAVIDGTAVDAMPSSPSASDNKAFVDLQSPLLPPGHKRLMLDVGARQWSGSPLWLARHYPQAKTFDFVAFELLDLEKDYSPAHNYFKSFRYIRKAGWMHDRGVKIAGVRMAKVVDGEEEKSDVAAEDKKKEEGQSGNNKGDGSGGFGPPPTPPPKGGPTYWYAPSVDLAAFIKNNSQPDDFVVMKLDIEGGEWPLIQHLVNEGVIPYYIDEIMMECHAKDPNTYALSGFKLLPAECMDLIADLREMGVYAHRWV